MSYLLSTADLKKLINLSSLKKREINRNKFYVKAWIAKINSETSTGCIIAPTRPSIIDTAKIIPKTNRELLDDELENESRKDTLWGDAKLLVKKISRDLEHSYNHEKEQRDNSVEKEINLQVELSETSQLKVGEEVCFRINDISRENILSLLNSAIHQDVFQIKGAIENISGDLQDFNHYLKMRKYKHYLKIIILTAIIIFSYKYHTNNVGPQ